MLIPLQLTRDGPLQEQLTSQLRTLILSGRLQPGTRMPSTRMFSEQFKVSRTTALLTYERLIAEHLLETTPANGTFVRHQRAAPPPPEAPPVIEAIPPASERHAGVPDPSLFPSGRWRSLVRAALDRLPCQAAANEAAGNPLLRDAIAAWLSMSRGLAVNRAQIILVNSRQQALHVLTQALQLDGRVVVTEDPTDPGAEAAFLRAGARLVCVPVDANGLCIDQLPDEPVALLHVTPEHQRPLGVRLANARRSALLDWAAAADALILEDDCDGDLRTRSLAAPTLTNLDRDGRVIMLGGFATSLGPWLAQAYLVVPAQLVAGVTLARRLADDSVHWLEEAALAEFLTSGAYARHIHRLGKTYATRRDALLAALQNQIEDPGPVWQGGAGLHLCWFPSPRCGDAAHLLRLARRSGLDAVAARAARHGEDKTRPLLLGFSRSEERIRAAVMNFAAALRGPASMARKAG